MKPTRREVVVGVTAFAVAPSCVKGGGGASDSAVDDVPLLPAPTRGPEPETLWAPSGSVDRLRFLTGIQVGDVTDNSVLVSVKSVDEISILRIAVAVEQEWLVLEDEYTLESEAGTAQLILEGLEPDTAYCVVAEVEGGRSDVARFRTALPPGGLRTITIGATSCLYGNRPWANISHVAAARPDMFFLLGDTVYADRAENWEEYREYWERALTTQGFRDLSQQTSIVATWDDHEVMNDFEGRNTAPERVAPALSAFREAIPQRVADDGQSIWRKLSWGATADIFVLDSRGERDGEEEYLSRAQMDWLKEGLLNSEARFKLILNSVPITDYTDIFGGVLLRDRWGGYPAQRTEILSHIEDLEIDGVLWITGDFHFCSAARVGRVGEVGESQWEVMVGPGGSTLNIAAKLLDPTEQFPVIFAEWTSSLITLDPGLGTVHVTWVGDDGIVLDEITIEL